VVPVSVRTGDGLEALRPAIARALGAGAGTARDTAAVTNVRHAALLERARVAVGRARAAVDASRGTLPEEFVLADLQDARAALEEITGARRTEDLLAHIFSRFCIGK
jgi:tRNA modification GTPase